MGLITRDSNTDTMSGLSVLDYTFIGTILEGLFFGFYCIVFALYIRFYTSKNGVNRNLLIYPLSTLFVLCTVYFTLDVTQQYFTIMRGTTRHSLIWHLNVSTSAIYSFIDFIAQGILIYRCWVVWSHQLLVVVVPFILSLVSLATALTLVGELQSVGETHMSDLPHWFTPIGISSFSISLAVNTIFTGLLAFKIAKTTPNAQRRNDLRPLISIILESGIVLFVVQLLWVVFFSIQHNAFYLIGGPIAMIYGLIPTLITVWVAMGDANDNQASSVESNSYADKKSAARLFEDISFTESRM